MNSFRVIDISDRITGLPNRLKVLKVLNKRDWDCAHPFQAGSHEEAAETYVETDMMVHDDQQIVLAVKEGAKRPRLVIVDVNMIPEIYARKYEADKR